MQGFHKVKKFFNYDQEVFNQLDTGKDIDFVLKNSRSEFLFGNTKVSLWNFIRSIKVKVIFNILSTIRKRKLILEVAQSGERRRKKTEEKEKKQIIKFSKIQIKIWKKGLNDSNEGNL